MSQLIVALDVDTKEEALGLVDQLAECVDIFKIGSQLFTASGPAIIEEIRARGKKVFLDLKYHDIPNTVANAVRAATGVFMLTVHIQGGERMLRAAAEAAAQQARDHKLNKPLIVGITVLTSDEKRNSITTQVVEGALLAQKCGLDGVVSSSQEVQAIRKALGKDFIIVTPGIRPEGSSKDDQERTATPRGAIEAGSDFLVIGRPIIKAGDPLAVTKKILEEIGEQS